MGTVDIGALKSESHYVIGMLQGTAETGTKISDSNLGKIESVIRDLLAALDEQGKVIEKLPVTSDGVTIYPGMVVWFADNDDPVEVDVGQDTVYDDDTYQHLASMVYSTPEAALAAREQAQGDPR